MSAAKHQRVLLSISESPAKHQCGRCQASVNKRTEEEQQTFDNGLAVMGSCYASMAGTAVLQHKLVPPCPPGHDAAAYNSTPYEQRGWCSFEGGVARLVVAHISAVVGSLPEQLQAAEVRRPKLIEIGGAEAQPCEVVDTPAAVLQQTAHAIESAKFTNGKTDCQLVQRMLTQIEWMDKVAMDELMEQHAKGQGELQSKPSLVPSSGDAGELSLRDKLAYVLSQWLACCTPRAPVSEMGSGQKGGAEQGQESAEVELLSRGGRTIIVC